MAQVCDLEPCLRLRDALKRYITLDENYEPERGVLVLEVKRKDFPDSPTVLEKLNLRYCPFCGTRVTRSSGEDFEQDIEEDAESLAAPV